MIQSNHGIFVIDGADGVGKTTQIGLLKEKYTDFEFIKFPNYNSDTGFFITKYLEGKFSQMFENLDTMDMVKKISTLYMMDRVNWFTRSYKNDKPLICDRYTTSNVIHMGILIYHNGGNINDIYEYINWLENVEYNELYIPRPDVVVYLDAPSGQLMKNLTTNRQVLDIHEDERLFKELDLIKKQIFDYCGWKVINCIKDNKMRSIESINSEIIEIINNTKK